MPKEPQDHLPKTVKPKTTKSADGFTVEHKGITLTIGTDALDDFELLRDLGKMQDRSVPDGVKVSLMPAVFERLVGPDQTQTVLNTLREPSGRVRIQPAMEFLFDIFGSLNPE